MHDLKVWVGVESDGNSPGSTPGKTSGQVDEMSRVAKVRMQGVCIVYTDRAGTFDRRISDA